MKMPHRPTLPHLSNNPVGKAQCPTAPPAPPPLEGGSGGGGDSRRPLLVLECPTSIHDSGADEKPLDSPIAARADHLPQPTPANDDSPLAQLRALRNDLEAEGRRDVAERLYGIEQGFQRSMTVGEAAALTGEKPSTIYKAIRDRHLPARTEGAGNRKLIRGSDLAVWSERPPRRGRA